MLFFITSKIMLYRVDRYGQPKDIVRAITYFGADNGIDRIVLEVLLRKHAAIRKATGVSVPVPGDSDGLVEALFEEPGFADNCESDPYGETSPQNILATISGERGTRHAA